MIANPEAIPAAQWRIHVMFCTCAGNLANCRALARARERER